MKKLLIGFMIAGWGLVTNSIAKEHSTGYRFMENILMKNPQVKSVEINEIKTKRIRGKWKGAIFILDIKTVDGKNAKEIIKLFYNKDLVVRDIFDVEGNSMLTHLKSPLISKKLAYDKDFKVLSRNANKSSSKGKNLVVVSDMQCPFCKKRIPSVLKMAKENNMNLYYIDMPLPIPAHVNSKNISICVATATALNKDKALEIIENAYRWDFGSAKKSFNDILKEFNKISAVAPISNKDVEETKSIQHIEKSMNVAKKLFIEGTPSIFIDGVRM